MSYYSNALAMRKDMDTAGTMLTDAQALEVPQLYKPWVPDTEYVPGERVRYEEVLYKCLTGHASQKLWNPIDAPSLWVKVLIPDPESIPEWEQPDSTNSYMTGDKVMHNGKTWVSDIDYNTWEPGVYGWTEVITDEK